MSLRLLFVNSSLTDGGSEKAMALVAQALVARGHKVTMALVREKEATYTIDSRIVLLQFHHGAKGRLFKFKETVRQIRRCIKSGAYDYVICYMWDLNVTTLIASLGLRARVIVSERGFPAASTRNSFSRCLERLLYRFAYRIVYQTRDAQAFCAPSLQGRSVVLPNMIESPRLQIHEGARSQRIVSIGRLTEQKNYPLLMRSFAQFLRDNPGWILEIFGRGALEGDLRALAFELGVADSVVFAGYVNDIPARILDAGMFALASDFEGISNAMSEAMALGLPVVCTDCPVGGAAMLIEDRVSGMLTPVGDQDALTRAMHAVATDEALARELSVGARASVARFTPDQLAPMWEDVVLCSGQGGSVKAKSGLYARPEATCCEGPGNSCLDHPRDTRHSSGRVRGLGGTV